MANKSEETCIDCGRNISQLPMNAYYLREENAYICEECKAKRQGKVALFCDHCHHLVAYIPQKEYNEKYKGKKWWHENCKWDIEEGMFLYP